MSLCATLDPRENVGIQQQVHLFLGQSTEYIRLKLQKFKGPDVRNLEKLVDETWGVYSNREEAYKQNMKKFMAVVRAEKGGGRQSCETREVHPDWAKITVHYVESLDTGKMNVSNGGGTREEGCLLVSKRIEGDQEILPQRIPWL